MYKHFEHVTNSIRKNFGKDKKMVAMFFNSIFLSIDAGPRDDDDMLYQIEDQSEPYNQEFLNRYLTYIYYNNWKYRYIIAC